MRGKSLYKEALLMLKAICSAKELTDNSYYDCVSDIIESRQIQELKSIRHQDRKSVV